MNYYFAFGLTIATEIHFPELQAIAPALNEDLRVIYGDISLHISKEIVSVRENVFLSPVEYLIYAEDISSYYVTNGNRVIIDPVAGAKDNKVRMMFLSVVMGAVLNQRGIMPLHASAIFYEDGVSLFMGESGAGKSTTVTALQSKGFRVFSDDVCVPVRSAEGFNVYAAYPMIKLCEDAFEKLSLGEVNREHVIERQDGQKYGKFFNESFSFEPQLVRKIFILEKDPCIKSVEFRRIGGIEAFGLLKNHSYYWSDFEVLNAKKNLFELCIYLSDTIPVYLIRRPPGENTIDAVAELIQTLKV